MVKAEAVKKRLHRKFINAVKGVKQPFVAIDCGALSKELAGSELFGHEKGAFTGALNQKIGSFELANGGTIFLDEIANLSYDIQVSLIAGSAGKKNAQGRRNKRILIWMCESLLPAMNHFGRRQKRKIPRGSFPSLQ